MVFGDAWYVVSWRVCFSYPEFYVFAFCVFYEVGEADVFAEVGVIDRYSDGGLVDDRFAVAV